MPAISPGAPVPAPKYVPFDYSKMTPGNYFSHSTGFADAYNWGGSGQPPSVVDRIYKEGVRVSPKKIGTKGFHPTAWNYKTIPEDFGTSAKNRSLAQKLGNPKGMADPRLEKTVKPKRAARISGHRPGVARPTGAPMDTFIMKGKPQMFSEPTSDFIPEKGGPRYKGNINPKKILGHFPKGSTQMMTKPGMVTGRMPMLRGMGGGMIDMFMEGPELQKAKSDPTYGMGEEERRNLEHAYQYGL